MEQKKWVATILAAFGVLVSGKTDYCGKQWECHETFKHFMCVFKKNTNTEKCHDIKTGISTEDKIRILTLVNEFRNNLAGGKDGPFHFGAGNVRQITWDNEMEEFAEVYGSQCGSSKVPLLDSCAKTEKFPEGARVLWGTIESDIDDVILGPEGWTSQVPNPEVMNSFEPVDGEDRFEPNYGRFTMLAWAKTYKMGCSIIKCTCEPTKETFKKLVCFLGPSGNIRGEPVLLATEACKSCPADTACKSASIWKSLCARPGDPDGHNNPLSLATTVHFSHVLYINIAATGINRVLNV